MTVSLALVVVMAALIACGVYLLLERSLTRVVLGFLLVGNGVNLLILIMAGPAGFAPIYDESLAPEEYSDPLPQALILTAIVITFAVSAFLLALIYRSWRLANADDVSDDADDVALREGSVTMPLEETAPDEGDTDFPVDEAAGEPVAPRPGGGWGAAARGRRDGRRPMMEALVPLVVLVPLFAAALTLVLGAAPARSASSPRSR